MFLESSDPKIKQFFISGKMTGLKKEKKQHRDCYLQCGRNDFTFLLHALRVILEFNIYLALIEIGLEMVRKFKLADVVFTAPSKYGETRQMLQ